MNSLKRNVIKICKFLKDNNALERYCMDVLLSHHKIVVPKNLPLRERTVYIVTEMAKKIRTNGYPRLEDFIESTDTCFCWEYTPEGTDFWRTLHDKWYYMITGGDYNCFDIL